MGTCVAPSPPRFSPSISIAHIVQQSHCSSIFVECCQLTISRFPQVNLRTRKSPHESIRVSLGGVRTYETDLYTSLEDNLIRHRGGRLSVRVGRRPLVIFFKKRAQKHKKTAEKFYKVKYIQSFIWRTICGTKTVKDPLQKLPMSLRTTYKSVWPALAF